jgi:hypothetical protein
MATGTRVRDLVHGAPVLTIAFSADGKRVATGGGDKAALVWDADSGALLHRIAGHDHGVSHLTFAADGSTLTTGTSTGDRAVWDLQVRPERPSPIRRYSEPDRPTEGTDVFDIAYTVDGTRYATTVLDRIPVIWDRATNTELHRLRGHREDVQCVRFSLDGRLLATGGRDDVAIVWDAASGTLLRRLVGHAGTIDDLAFSPDADQIATVSDDGTVILWDVSTGAALHRFERPTYSIRDVVFSPDGKRLLISGSARTISPPHRIIPETIETLVVYDIDLASLVARSCDILDPGVSAEAWARMVPGRPYPLSCQDLEELTNASRRVQILGLMSTALSGARLYWEYWGKEHFNAKGVSIPVAVSVFPDELYPAPRSCARAYPKLIHYKKLDKGGLSLATIRIGQLLLASPRVARQNDACWR